MSFAWTCPFCNHDTIIPSSNVASSGSWFTIENAHCPKRLDYTFVVCPNPKCMEFTLSVFLEDAHQLPSPSYNWLRAGNKTKWRLIPPSEAKVFPSYIPKPILDDYREACLISDLSPRASATIARRCLQGMIRDFWNIRKARLIDEIEAIKDSVDPLTWKAIDAVRSVGNIGAHMEKDINLIVDVEPEEAAQLIGLIELLLRDWYITRHEREQRLKSIVQVAEDKEDTKRQPSKEAEHPGFELDNERSDE